jgi:four helix bundle protein
MICENLEVWKRSKVLAVNVYKTFASGKDYGFKDQITRSALSVASNIAEGMERKTGPDKVRFLVIAKGSVAELKIQTQIGQEVGYIDKVVSEQWQAETEIISRMLQKLIQSLDPRP